MSYFLGIDQGGTKTAAAVCDASGIIVGAGLAQGACHQTSGMDCAMARVVQAAREALDPKGLSFRDIAAVGGGLTGVDWEEETPLVAQALQKATGVVRVQAKNDVFGAFYAGASSSYGACICSGTSTNICVVAPGGREHSFNFYCRTGHPGRMGLECVFDSHCGIRDKTSLTEMALAHFEYADVDSLMRGKVDGRIPNAAFRRFAPAVLRAAAAGDPVACDCVAAYGRSCAGYVTAGLRRFAMERLPSEVVLSGGVFKTPCPPLIEAIRHEIGRHAPKARLTAARLEPVVGCLAMAMELAGIDAHAPAIRDRLHESALTWNLIRVQDE